MDSFKDSCPLTSICLAQDNGASVGNTAGRDRRERATTMAKNTTTKNGTKTITATTIAAGTGPYFHDYIF